MGRTPMGLPCPYACYAHSGVVCDGGLMRMLARPAGSCGGCSGVGLAFARNAMSGGTSECAFAREARAVGAFGFATTKIRKIINSIDWH